MQPMDYEQQALEFLSEHRAHVEKMCRWLTRRAPRALRPQLFEAAMDEVHRTLPMAMRNYDPTKSQGATKKTYVMNFLRWKVWREVRREARRKRRYRTNATVPEAHSLDDSGSLARDQVQYLVGKLPADQAQLLQWHYCQGLTFAEIGERLECSTSSAHGRFERALEAIRQLAGEMK